jgi:hypothetical protein
MKQRHHVYYTRRIFPWGKEKCNISLPMHLKLKNCLLKGMVKFPSLSELYLLTTGKITRRKVLSTALKS